MSIGQTRQIKAGDKWREEISKAISEAAVAILLVSADFLASDFIAENELPPLLEAAEKDGVKIISVILKKCAYNETKAISCYQAHNNPSKPVISMHASYREELWYRLAQKVSSILKDKTATPEPSTADTVLSTPDPNSPDSMRAGLIAGELKNPAIIGNFHVYQYHYIDCVDYMLLASDVLAKVANKDQVIKAVEKCLKTAGWEGDGELRLMWLPPFLGAGIEDTWGMAVWFVKQSNNGTAFLASPIPLPFQALLDQKW